MRHTAVVGLIILAVLEGCSHTPPSSPTATAPAAQPVVSRVPSPASSDSPSPPTETKPDAKTSAPIAAPTPAVAPDRPQPAPAPRSVADQPATTTASGATPPSKTTAAAAATVARPAAPLAPKQTTSAAPVTAATSAGQIAQVAPVAPATPAAPPSLDLPSLEQRLRDTHAIGLFTKLSIKNQVDELLSQFRAYHRGDKTVPPSQLRQRYDGLLMKVLSALQNGDPPLAAQIWSSREAIWGVLADPTKFEKI